MNDEDFNPVIIIITSVMCISFILLVVLTYLIPHVLREQNYQKHKYYLIYLLNCDINDVPRNTTRTKQVADKGKLINKREYYCINSEGKAINNKYLNDIGEVSESDTFSHMYFED